jgi:hypothetical protein
MSPGCWASTTGAKNILVSLQAKRRLERLASCYGVTQRNLLERLLTDAEHAVLATLSDDAQDAFYESG